MHESLPEAMSEAMSEAMRRTAEIVRAVRPDQLALPTPCTEYDVAGLGRHLTYWGVLFSERAARKQQPMPDAGPDDVGVDWAQTFARHADQTVAAWSVPDAWTGTTSLAGVPMPAALVGSLMLAELVLHGWDLAVATGQRPAYSTAVAETTRGIIERMAGQGRAAGIFAEPVPVPDSASPLDRALAFSGRDPAWTARQSG
ncbi:TIGR03086 family metal-binding protein [Micromonospora sp. NPDC003197]